MTAIANPFPPFTDATGRPLEGGRVFVGLPGLDPELHPVPVFWDKARAVPAAQPLRTVAGVVARAGGPSRAYVDGAYSIRVRQADGALVYADLSTTSLDQGVAVATIEDLRAAPVEAASLIQGGSLWTFTPGDFTGRADDATVVKADAVALSAGAWVRARIERRSVLDFIPSALHAAIRARTGTADLSPYVQAALDAIPSGGELVFPDGAFRLATGLACAKSVGITGVPGRPDFDNSWDYGDGGTLLDFRGTGNALTFTPPDTANRSIAVTLRGFLLRGARVTQGAMTGHGIEVDGRNRAGTRVKLLMDNVHVTEAAGIGLYVHGAVYGGSVRDCYLFRNGKRGFLGQNSGTDTTGETVVDQMRCFQNGATAGDEDEGTGFTWLGGHLSGRMISATENAGPGMLLGGGSISIDAPHCESNGGTAQIRVGAPGAGTSSVQLRSIETAPGDGYTGSHIHLTQNANGVSLEGGFFGDTLGTGGSHIKRDAGSQVLDVGVFGATVPLKMLDASADYQTRAVVHVVARLATAGEAQTGDGTNVDFRPDGEVLDPWGAFNPATGVFTAPLNALYAIEGVLPLIGLAAAHNVAQVLIQSTSFARTIRPGNVGAMADANGGLSLPFAAVVPMKAGETVKVSFNVNGGPATVGTTGGGTHGFLTVVVA